MDYSPYFNPTTRWPPPVTAMDNVTELGNQTNRTLPDFLEFYPFFSNTSAAARVIIALLFMIFGCVANIVSLLALSHARINQIPRGLLIIFIVIADNLYLTLVLVVEMSDSFTLRLKSGCPYLYFVLYTFKLWSYILVLLFLLDRVIAVKYSSWYKKRSSKFWTKFIICVSLATSACTSVFLLVFVHYETVPVPVGHTSCVVSPDLYEPFVLYLGIALLGLGEVVIELLALVCTGWIIYSLVLWPEKLSPEKPEKENGIEIKEIKAETDDNANKDKTESCESLEEGNCVNKEYEMEQQSEKEPELDIEGTVCSLRYVPNYTVEASVIGAGMVILCVPQTVSFMYFHIRSPSLLTSGQVWYPHVLLVIQTMSLSFHGIKLLLYLCSSKLFRESFHRICCSCFR